MAMRLLAGMVVAAALGGVGSAAAEQTPILRSATVVDQHAVLEISVTDFRPLQMLVARRRAVDADGSFRAKNIRMLETIEIPAAASGVVRWRSPKTLRPGTYFLQVEAFETGGVTDCPPKQRNCNERWSNVRRVVVRKSS
jgi:hypothetical protein